MNQNDFDKLGRNKQRRLARRYFKSENHLDDDQRIAKLREQLSTPNVRTGKSPSVRPRN